jgi:hypothetical protein
MADNPNQPKAYDVVLGGQVPIPSSVAVLGGLEGIKRHLTSAVALQRISALSDALKYGQKGLALVIQALKDESWEVQQSAYSLLLGRTEPSVQQAFEEYLPSVSAVGMDYTQLRNLLIARKWQEANQETKTVMLEVARREKGEDWWHEPDGSVHIRDTEGWLNGEQLQRFPCKDLLTINQLWVKCSSGRFGFTVQNHIWQSAGGTNIYDYETECRFYEQVGWSRVSSLQRREGDIFTVIDTPLGNLPCCLYFLRFHDLASRLTSCSSSLTLYSMEFFCLLAHL